MHTHKHVTHTCLSHMKLRYTCEDLGRGYRVILVANLIWVQVHILGRAAFSILEPASFANNVLLNQNVPDRT